MISPTGRKNETALSPARGRTRAFTFIEMLLAVFLIMVLAGMTVPYFGRSWSRLKLRSVAYELSYRMRFAQSWAIRKGTRVRLAFAQDARTYNFQLAAEEEPESGAHVSYESLPGRWGRAVSVSSDIEVAASPEEAVFTPDGRIDLFQCQFCRRTDCYLVSTAGSRGAVDVWFFPAETLTEGRY